MSPPTLADARQIVALSDQTPQDEVSLGPEMKALTVLQRGFVTALLEQGGSNYTRAALAAGYRDGVGLRATAAALAHNPRVIAAIHAESRKRMAASGVMIVSEALAIAQNKHHKDQLKAIEFIANRTGLHATQESVVTTRIIRGDDDKSLRAELMNLARELGLDAKVLLGTPATGIVPGRTLEADFTMVDDGREGLEDLL